MNNETTKQKNIDETRKILRELANKKTVYVSDEYVAATQADNFNQLEKQLRTYETK